MKSIAALTLIIGGAAAAQGVIKYAPSPDPDERPLAKEIAVGVQGSDLALRVVFDKEPWGDKCKNRCANATVFIDTDGSKETGLMLGKEAAETGADLAVTIQGTREYREKSSEISLRVRVRQLGDAVTSVDQGDAIADLDHKNDPQRVQVEDDTVYVLVDATSGTLPSGKTMRFVYHPPGAKALTATTKGFLAHGGGKVEIFKKPKK